MKCFSIFVAGLWVAFATTTALADISLNAVVDGQARRNALGVTVDDTEEVVGTSRSGGNNVRNGIFEFDLSGIAAGTTVYSATIEFELTSNISNIGSTANFKVGQYAGNGAVDTGDYADFLNFSGDIEIYDTTTNGGPGNGDVLTIDLNTTTIQSVIDDGALDYVGLRTATENFASFQVVSNEGFAAGNGMAPTLTLQTVPEPGSMVLLVLGGSVGLLGRRRRG